MSELRTNRIVPRDGLVSTTTSSGGIIQVKHTIFSSTYSRATSSYDFGAIVTSDSITPTRSDSKILIMATTNIQAFVSSQEVSGGLRLLRGSSEIIEYPYAFVMEAGTSGNGRIFYNTNHSATFLDSPSTTSAVTYKVQLKLYGTSNGMKLVYNQNSSKSTILVMEVSG